jgi:7-cyano-7-deazaguanine synthase in queuosine biosynthesis
MMNCKAILMNSGGPDCLASAISLNNKYELHSFYVNVGLPCHERAKPVIEKIAEKYCKSHYEMKIEGNWGVSSRDFWDKDFLLGVPNIYNKYMQIPSQFMIYGSLAYMYTAHNGIRTIISGCKKDIKGKQLGELLNMAPLLYRMGHTLQWEFPIYDLLDEEISKIVLTDTDLCDHTISCNAESPCGGCHKCLRKNNVLKLKEEPYVKKD